MAPVEEMLHQQIEALARLDIDKAPKYPQLATVSQLARLTREVYDKNPNVGRSALLARLLKNNTIGSIANHLDDIHPEMGLMAYISSSLLPLVRHSLKQLSLVLNQDEKIQLDPLEKKFLNPNMPKNLLAIVEAAALLVPQLHKTDMSNTTSVLDVSTGKERQYHFDYRIIQSDPDFINKLITISQD